MLVLRIDAHGIVGNINKVPSDALGTRPISADGAIGSVKVVTGDTGGLGFQNADGATKDDGDHPCYGYS